MKSGSQSVIVPDHRGDRNQACYARSAVPLVGNGRRSDDEKDDHAALLCRGRGGRCRRLLDQFSRAGWLTSAAISAAQIVTRRATRWTSVAMDEDDGELPLSIAGRRRCPPR